MKAVLEGTPDRACRAIHQLLKLSATCMALAGGPSSAQVLITYTNSGNNNWGSGITAHNMPTLEAAQAQIVYDLRNAEPLSPAEGGIPSSRF